MKNLKYLFLLSFFLTSAVVANPSPQSYFMKQVWENLLMVHWSVPLEQIRKHVPPEFKILTFSGRAFVGAVALNMETGSIVSLGKPISGIPLYTSFGQLNYRTYVSYKGKKGIYFLNLFAENRPTVLVANKVFGLPYLYSKVTTSFSGGELDFVAKYKREEIFKVKSQVVSEARVYSRESLENFLTENMYYFQLKLEGHKRCVYSGELWHKPWQLAEAKSQVSKNEYFHHNGLDLDLERVPFDLYSHSIDVFFYAPRRTCRSSSQEAFQ